MALGESQSLFSGFVQYFSTINGVLLSFSEIEMWKIILQTLTMLQTFLQTDVILDRDLHNCHKHLTLSKGPKIILDVINSLEM